MQRLKYNEVNYVYVRPALSQPVHVASTVCINNQLLVQICTCWITLT